MTMGHTTRNPIRPDPEHESPENVLPRRGPIRRVLRWMGFSCVLIAALIFGGFLRFADSVTTLKPPAEPRADAIIVLTGGYQRIDQAVELLQKGAGKRLLISGAHPSTTPTQIRRMTQWSANLFSCCVDIGYDALDTIGNAEEASNWIHAKGYKSILVVTNNDKAKGDALAERLGRELYAMREKTAMTMLNTEDGIARSLAVRKENPDRPVVIADIWDNPGGGVAGDGTVVLRAMLARGIDNVGVATIWDPIAVTFCQAAGEGAVIDLRFGGKAGPLAGEPIDARVKVLKAVPEGWQSFGPSRVTLGPTALVRIEGTEVDIILNTNRTQTFEPDIFFNIGVDPLAKDILLVKSTNHFYAGFAPIASEIIYVSAPSSYPSDPAVTNYTKLTRPIWPRVADPWKV